MPKVSETIVVDVPPKKIYEVALDFEKYPEFLSDVKEATVQNGRSKSLIVDFDIKVIKSVQYTLKVTGTPYKSIRWELIKGALFKKNNGEWNFKEEGKGKTRATYMIDIDFGLFVPSMITSRLIGSNLPSMMKKFKERAEGLES
ncbi:MAG: SRPBCC family protein [Deltaproteobacteria bacterium]|nr:SRPBCC family protein [Deltaproteobacteria bacterium]MBI4373550.1 SRPBCC family protein [Deltaproteobacteria bacterium]